MHTGRRRRGKLIGLRPQAHIAASLVVWGAARDAPLWEAPVCALAGNLPDLDRSVAKRLGVTRRDHHRWVSHSFVGWAPPTALALALDTPAARRAIVALWLHLALDTYADGIAWLWPLHKDKLGFFQRTPGVRDRGWRTPAPLSSRTGRAEALLWGLLAAALLRR